MDGSSRLQIPDYSSPGPSQGARPGSSSRPASTTVISTLNPPIPQPQSTHQSSRKRASHTVTTGQQQPVDPPIYRDVYSHPAAVAYASSHPKRTIPKFGPYLLLQTLGEGEFGKVKLGLHGQWGEEVAVKLIRRGNIDTQVRMSKVEREIEVLRTIKHPNIVRLYDVIETDKYIGIILEYASGGELFDHILAHRYLKERDACKLFAQLISGVWYIHQKKIVHRDLKLENLLLDRHRNVIITDFGFANRFEHRADDLMQTSCGSPCYAAPELVISEGLYVGSAVDIWSCGVILYAMLAGYLPFDDDPLNPDGDNINLLYKYIVNTALTFPDYVSIDARNLLSIMLVPDPHHRADLDTIMTHPWLKPYAHLFEKSVADLEQAAISQHEMKRLAYQRQMKQQAAAGKDDQGRIQRSLSAQTATPASAARMKVMAGSTTNPDFLYDNTMDDSLYSPPAPPVQRRHATSAVVVPTATHGRQALVDDDPFAASVRDTIRPGMTSMLSDETVIEEGTEDSRRNTIKESPRSSRKTPQVSVAATPEKKRADRQRHTIQLEYGGEPDGATPIPSRVEHVNHQRNAVAPTPGYQSNNDASLGRKHTTVEPSGTSPSPTHGRQHQRRVSEVPESMPSLSPPATVSTARSSDKKMTAPPSAMRPSISPSSNNFIWSQQVQPPPEVAMANTLSRQVEETLVATEQSKAMEDKQLPVKNGSIGSGSSGGRHRKGISVDKIVGKLWGSSQEAVTSPGNASGTSSRVPSELSVSGQSGISNTPPGSASRGSFFKEKNNDGKKSRRNTLTVMVEPFSRQIKQRTKARSGTGENVASQAQAKEKDLTAAPVRAPPSPTPGPVTPNYEMPRGDVSPLGLGVPASTNKASKVMQWFRSKSKGGRSPSEVLDEFENVTHSEATARSITPTAASIGPNAPVQVVVTTPTSGDTQGTYQSPQAVSGPSPSMLSDTSLLSSPHAGNHVRTFAAISTISNTAGGTTASPRGGFNKNVLHLHTGAVDHDMVTSSSPPEVMRRVAKVLLECGFEVQQESEYKYRCIRHKRKKHGGNGAGGLAAFTIVGSAASNGVDKRGLPVPSAFGTGNMLRGLLMRRQSSQVSSNGAFSHVSYDSDIHMDPNQSREVVAPLPSAGHDTIYGDKTRDQGDEIRFSVELTRLDGLHDTYCLDIRRLKGNLRSYKFLYDTIRDRCDLQR